MSRKVGIILSYVNMLFEILSTLLLTPYIIHTLGQAEYGVYKLSAAIVAYLLLLDLGVGNSTIRYLSKYRAQGNEAQSRKFIGVATLYYVVIAFLTFIIGEIIIAIFPSTFSKGLSYDEIKLGQVLLRITVINAAITLGTSCFANAIIAYERFAFSRWTSILQIVVRMTLTYIALKMQFGSIGIVTINLCLTFLCRGAYVAYSFTKLKLYPVFRQVDFVFVKEVVLYSSFILLQMIATQLNASADQVMLGMLVQSSATVIAVYSIGTQIVQYFQSIGSAFTSVLMPGIVRMVENKALPEQVCNEMVRIGRIILSVLLCIYLCFIVFGKKFIMLWASEQNVQAYYVTSVLMLAYLFILTESVGTQVLWAMNEHKEQSILKIGIVLLNIVLTVFLIRWNPLLGATIGTFISLMVGDVAVMNWVFHEKIGISLKQYYEHLFHHYGLCVLLTLLSGILIRLCNFSGWVGFFIGVLCMVVVYSISMWLYGMNDYEKSLISQMIKKIIRVN